MTIHDDVDGLGFSGSAFGLISSAMVEMMWLNGRSGAWLQNIQSLNRKNKLAYRYRPNFDKLFEKYCRASVRIDYQVFAEQGQPFVEITGNESAEELYVLSKVSIYYFHQDKHNK